VARTIEKVIEVVPTAVWLALGALLLLAATLGARAFIERRRARDLDLDRQRLLRDIGALERALLPAVPETLGALAVSVAHRASEGPAAGGDFYDAFELDGGRVALLVGDVCGHGPEALDRTNSLRGALHASLRAGLSPRAALESVGSSAWVASGGKFVTAVVAVHDPADGTLTYATAGHPPPIFAGRAAHEPLTAAASPPLGMGLRTGLRETTVPLPSDAVAVLFTDGLLEARMSGDLIGREELTRFVAELGPEQGADSLLAQVVAVADEAPDDMAVCVLRATAGAETLPPRTEKLVLDADDIALGIPERFLEACDVPEYQAATTVEALADASADAGGALLEVTIDDSGPHVRVTRPGAELEAGMGVNGVKSL
jgi:serine phosphatase RsbU (regulator of sigma subunit)